jgi:hypothetical protein
MLTYSHVCSRMLTYADVCSPGALMALAAALNAVELDEDRLWCGAWRWFSSHWLRMALPAGAYADVC